MRYFLTVVAADGTVLFGGNTTDAGELEAVAAEARRLRPTATIFLRSPNGDVVEFDPLKD